jgi:hypothetical protein
MHGQKRTRREALAAESPSKRSHATREGPGAMAVALVPPKGDGTTTRGRSSEHRARMAAVGGGIAPHALCAQAPVHTCDPHLTPYTPGPGVFTSPGLCTSSWLLAGAHSREQPSPKPRPLHKLVVARGRPLTRATLTQAPAYAQARGCTRAPTHASNPHPSPPIALALALAHTHPAAAHAPRRGGSPRR